MNKECQNRKFFVMAILLLVLLISLIFIVNYWHYFKINKDYVGNGILQNILTMISNSTLAVICFFASRKYEERGSAWLWFVTSPIWIGMITILLNITDLSVDGYQAWINIGPTAFHYM